MLLSTQWFKQYFTADVVPANLAQRLTLAGWEVEKQHAVQGDTVFELEITPNRPDCLNYLGLAREAAAIFNKLLRKPKMTKPVFKGAACDISIEDKKGCLRYMGAILTNVKIGPSSSLIQQLLTAVGLRSVNNIVDITNFCLMETGQPMHAFDLDKLEGKKIIVRRAKAGEKIRAINDEEYSLDPSILVIADEKKPVAIAGIMGGKGTEVTDQTKNILLESAYFDPILIRRASRKLGLRSESSYRFERGVDMDMVEKGCWRAIALITEAAGGQKTAFKDTFVKGKNKAKQKPIEIRVDQVEKFLGTAVTLARMKNILTKLEFQVAQKGKDTLRVRPPSFRNDVCADVDVMEDIARIIGYDRLNMRLPSINADNLLSSPQWFFNQEVARILTGAGLDETISYSLISEKALTDARMPTRDIIRNQNPLTEDQEILRPSLLPSLLRVVSDNMKKGQKELNFFESGKTYFLSGEKDVVAIIRTGFLNADWRSPQARKQDFYDIKGSVEALLDSLKITDYTFLRKDHDAFESGQCAQIVIGSERAGLAGKICAEILDNWDIKHQDVFYAEIEAGLLRHVSQAAVCYQPLCGYPAVVRDISLAISKETTFAQVQKTIALCREELLKSVAFIEQYLGDKIPMDQRGITISLTYQSFERTLTEDEVEQAHQKICQTIISDLKAIKR